MSVKEKTTRKNMFIISKNGKYNGANRARASQLLHVKRKIKREERTGTL